MKIPAGHILDPCQEVVAGHLRQLSADLKNHQDMSWLDRALNRIKNGHKNFTQGLYIYGTVGRGKTMLMDAFFDDLPIGEKQRWHFHAFMQQQVHQRLRALENSKQQPIELLAKEIAANAKVLCFDEFHVTDIADAMILGRLFSLLFDLGTVVVATSNQHPDELYQNGLHRDRFLPFIETLKHYCRIVSLDGSLDYRRAILQKHQRYFYPINDEAKAELDDIFQELTYGKPPKITTLEVGGRDLILPITANGVARISFSDLCEHALGASDYLSLADHFHTILLEDVPVLNEDMHNEAKRFITLIDILYDRSINVVISAAANPDNLYKSGKNSDFFLRTASRLIEMTGRS